MFFTPVSYFNLAYKKRNYEIHSTIKKVFFDEYGEKERVLL